MPLVILLHGYFPFSVPSGGAWYESWMQFQPLAEARGFLYCYPEGTLDRSNLRYWNGIDANDFWSDGVDDAGYLRALIEQIGRQFAVDRKRVYLIGHSSGADMVYTAACQSADLLAGIAGLAGSTFMDPNRCQPVEPVNALCICGTADETSYYGGTWGLASPETHSPSYPGTVRTAQIWASYNGARDPVTDPVPTLNLDLALPGLDTVITRYANYPPGGAVELWTINGGGHVPLLSSGNSSSELVPRVIDWLFAHPKP